MVKTNSCLTQDSFWSSSMFRIQPCVHLRPEEEQMTDLESGASALLSNNETAVIAWTKNRQQAVDFLAAFVSLWSSLTATV